MFSFVSLPLDLFFGVFWLLVPVAVFAISAGLTWWYSRRKDLPHAVLWALAVAIVPMPVVLIWALVILDHQQKSLTLTTNAPDAQPNIVGTATTHNPAVQDLTAQDPYAQHPDAPAAGLAPVGVPPQAANPLAPNPLGVPPMGMPPLPPQSFPGHPLAPQPQSPEQLAAQPVVPTPSEEPEEHPVDLVSEQGDAQDAPAASGPAADSELADATPTDPATSYGENPAPGAGYFPGANPLAFPPHYQQQFPPAPQPPVAPGFPYGYAPAGFPPAPYPGAVPQPGQFQQPEFPVAGATGYPEAYVEGEQPAAAFEQAGSEEEQKPNETS